MENITSNLCSIEKIFSDEFVSNVLSAKSNDEIKAMFKKSGLDLTDEQLDTFKKSVNRELLEELSDDGLKEASGGNLDIESIRNYATQGAGFGIASGSLAGAGLEFLGSLIKCKKNKVRKAFLNAAKMSGIGAFSGAVIGGIAGTGIGMT